MNDQIKGNLLVRRGGYEKKTQFNSFFLMYIF